MFDAETVQLIAEAPPLEGLDLERLPQRLTEIYAQIVASRVRLRQAAAGGELPTEVQNATREMQRLAATHEAFVATVPDREDRAAAAFVAASAHHVCLLADRMVRLTSRPSRLDSEAISPEVSAALLFLVAEASPDAAEMVKQIRPSGDDVVETRLLLALGQLATGQLQQIVAPAMPAPEMWAIAEPAIVATRSLYFPYGGSFARARHAGRRTD